MIAARAVTFDVGQVLAVFEPALLAAKLSERGGGADPARLEAATAEGWQAYGEALRAGRGAEVGWKLFIATLMRRAGARPEPDEALLDWLFVDNRARNLWCRPVAPMIALARALRARGVPVGVVSNSEGRLVELLESLGCGGLFVCVADSGVLGLEKPRPEIFAWAFERLGVEAGRVVHVGDSWAADVEGALGVGARAVWFPAGDDRGVDRDRVWPARSAHEVAEGLSAFGLPRVEAG